MFKTLATLITASNARAEDRVRDAFAIELIDQKIREAEARLKAGKATLASLIQRQRAERSHREALQRRLTDMTVRAEKALKAGDEDMAREAAEAVATMENELMLRDETCARLDQKVLRLRGSIESGHRRIVDLKQGAIQARAVRREQEIQMRMGGSPDDATQEAEDLIARVLGRDDPFERSQIVAEIDRDLSGDTLADRMADKGYGPATRTTAEDVLKRLKAKD